MPAETILFLDDKAHAWQSGPSVYGVSSTAPGYSPEAVRDISYSNAWKPNDSAVDEYIQYDLGTASWLGTTGGDTIYVVVAYDSTGSDQSSFSILQDGGDNPAGTFSSLRATFNISSGGPTSDTVSFLLTGGGKRYYRLSQPNSARGGGTRTAKIFNWGFYRALGVVRIEDYQGGNTSPGASDLLDMVGSRPGPSGFNNVQASARMRHEFEIHIRRAKKPLWTDLVNGFHLAGAGARACYAQYEGLKNIALPTFQMARVADMRWAMRRPYVDECEVSIPMRTEVHA